MASSETDLDSDANVDFEKQTTKRLDLKLTSLKRHKCPYEGCKSAFNRPWKLDRHINTHTKNRPFKCDFPGCTKDYTNNSHLQRHKSLSHSGNKSPRVYIYCPYPDCMRTFSNKWSLKKHCNAHKNGGSYKCQICSLGFRKHKQLKDHVNTHLGLKPHTCSKCSESFENGKDLKKHERQHKTYECCEEGCGQTFSTYNGLRTHNKNHHPNWLECDACGSIFLNKWTLTEHVLSHLPENSREVVLCPFPDCGRHYFHQRNLDHHIKSFHQNINYECTICKETLVSNSKLRQHIRTMHESPRKEKRPSRTSGPSGRKPRKDKGQPRKSRAALLSGIRLPSRIDRDLARDSLTSEGLEYLHNVSQVLRTDASTDDEETGG